MNKPVKITLLFLAILVLMLVAIELVKLDQKVESVVSSDGVYSVSIYGAKRNVIPILGCAFKGDVFRHKQEVAKAAYISFTDDLSCDFHKSRAFPKWLEKNVLSFVPYRDESIGTETVTVRNLDESKISFLRITAGNLFFIMDLDQGEQLILPVSNGDWSKPIDAEVFFENKPTLKWRTKIEFIGCPRNDNSQYFGILIEADRVRVEC